VGADLSPILELQIRCDQSAPSVVREAIGAIGWLGWVAGDVMLVASELVSNAVVYSGCSEQHLLDVRLDREADHLVLSVRDPGLSGQNAAVAVGDGRTFGGLGLWVVEQLARRWGAERNHGYRVWAELALAG
jgi:anti-sigma regulatory factor (Ser/Thr protein kinase)